MEKNAKILTALSIAPSIQSEYDALPESIKLVHSVEGFAWLGDSKWRVIERETNPDDDVTE